MIPPSSRAGLLLLAALLATLSSRCMGREPAQPAPPTRDAPCEVRTVRLDQLRFLDEALGEKLRRMDAAANRIAGPTWHRRPYSTFTSPLAQGVYFAEWATFADANGRNPWNYHGPEEAHCIDLSAFFDPKEPATVKGIGLSARWKPGRAGWAATLRYVSNQGRGAGARGREEFNFSFTPFEDKGMARVDPVTTNAFGERRTRRARMDFSYRGGWFSDIHLIGDTLYSFSVSAPAPAVGQLDAEVLRILASPESMRDFAAAQQETLVKRLKEDIPSGRALTRAEMANRVPSRRGEDARSTRKLTAEEKQLVLDDALVGVQWQLDCIRRDYKEMYAVLEHTFPIRECLLPSAKPQAQEAR